MKKIFAAVFLCSFYCAVFGQVHVDPNGRVGIGTNQPHSSAKLDLSSATKTFLKPRVTTAQMLDIVNPGEGLEVFNVDENVTYYYDSASWVPIANSSSRTYVLEDVGIDIAGDGSNDNPYVISQEAIGGNQGDGNNAINLIYNDETVSATHNAVTESANLKQVRFYSGDYDKVIVEFIVHSNAYENRYGNPIFYWNIKHGGQTIKTYIQRALQYENTSEFGNVYTNTISAAIELPSETAFPLSLSITSQVFGSNTLSSQTFARVEAMRVYSVKESSMVSLEGVQGDIGSKGPVGLQGPNGNPGQQGEPGGITSLSVGSATTLDSNEPPSIAISGTPPTQSLVFGIPRGEDGMDAPIKYFNAGNGITINGTGLSTDPYIVGKLANGTVENITAELPLSATVAGDVVTIEMADNSITSNKYASSSIQGSNIKNNEIRPEKIQNGNEGQILATIDGKVEWTSASNLLNNDVWLLGGNTVTAREKLGLSIDKPLDFYVNNQSQLSIEQNGRIVPQLGKILIGTEDPGGLFETTVFGGYSGNSNTIANVSVGFESGNKEQSSGNTMVGYQAGNLLANSNICLGYRACLTPNSVVDNSISASIGIGAESLIDASNIIRVGNINTEWIGGEVKWTVLSDQRIKKNIVSNVKGLDFILRLNPVTYKRDIEGYYDHFGLAFDQDYNRTFDTKVITGFIAQEVLDVANQINYDFSGIDIPSNENGLLGLRYATFTIPIIKAIQEQQAQIEEQNRRIVQLSESDRLTIKLNEQEQKLKSLLTRIQNLK